VDNGEIANYTYDHLNRLTQATAANHAWGAYDGFGNLTGKIPTYGSAPAFSGGAGSNNQAGQLAPNFDIEQRLTTSGGTSYVYDPWGRRIWREWYDSQHAVTLAEAFFYGATGKVLESYACNYYGAGNAQLNCNLEGINTYIAGQMLSEKGVYVATDRLGSVRGDSNGVSMQYYPWGEERTSTADGRTKFAGYYRDAPSQDYAMARYYNASSGSFASWDPGGMTTAKGPDPVTWNRNTYANADPVNLIDPSGMSGCVTGYVPGYDGGAAPVEVCSYDGPGDPVGPTGGPGAPGAADNPCNPNSNPTTQMKINFVSANWSAALTTAKAVQTDVQQAAGKSGLTIDVDALATVFLQWSSKKSGYGTNPQLVAQNNDFGQQVGWTGSIPCPKNNPLIPPNTKNACFAAGTTWGQELIGALDYTSSQTGVTFLDALVNSLVRNPRESPTAMLASIGANGWNPLGAKWAASITSGQKIQSVISCLGLH
jgi:RHS repeat-associated protein